MNLREALDYLDSAIGDPCRGLPEEVFRYVSSIVPMVNVDLLIRNEQGHTLLTWREDEFFPPAWHIPGGIIRYKESARDRIRAVAANELGAEVHFPDAPLAIHETIMEPSWRIRGHFLSLLYECRLQDMPTVPQARNLTRPFPGEWAWHQQCPDNFYSSQAFYRPYIVSKNNGIL